MKITRRQLRQIIKEEINLLEAQEGVDPELPPTREELEAILDDFDIPSEEQAPKIEYLLSRFAEDPEGAAQEIMDMYSAMGQRIIDVGETALTWLEKNVLSPTRKVLGNPTPQLPSTDEGVINENHT